MRYIHDAIRKNSDSKKSTNSLELTGLKSWAEVRNIIENQFEEGMTWDNWTKDGWHLDHVRPTASFDITDHEQQKTCFNWRNLQPLWSSKKS